MSPRPMSATPGTPIPGTPAPEYKPFDAHEMAPGVGRDGYSAVEVHAVPSTAGRMELAGS